jgi:4-aminobutyrate aminotransferase-like enzyme
MTRVFFANSGAEANDGAIKLALKHALKTSKKGLGIVALEYGFHGRLSLPLSLSGLARRKQGLGPYAMFPGIVHVTAPYAYRLGAEAGRPLDEAECCERSLGDLEKALKFRVPGGAAALIAEPIPCVGGVFVPPRDYWPRVRELCDRHGMLLIFDEVFCGWGRTGTLFAHEQWGVRPDILTFAKAIGGGLPLAGFVASDEIATAFEEGDHYTTFGGNNQLGVAAGHAVLDILETEHLVDEARAKGEHFLSGLMALQERYPCIGDVRGRGLMIGVEIVADRHLRTPDPHQAQAIQRMMQDLGVLVSASGAYGNVLRITPPLVITYGQIDTALARLAQSMDVLERRG